MSLISNIQEASAHGQGVYGRLLLSESVVREIKGIHEQVDAFVAGKTDAASFRAYRVAMGIYEQRQDGAYMARVRLPGGAADAQQLETLADLGERFGKGVLHFTTRQDIQLHDLPLGAIPEVFAELLKVGLICRGGGGNTVRNITSSALAGLNPDEAFDVLPYVIQISEHFLSQTSAYNLPRKLKLAFASANQDEHRIHATDLGFIARRKDDQPGFSVWAGGGMGLHSSLAVPIEEFIPAADAVVYAEAVKRLFDQHGDRTNKHRARLRFVAQRLGENAFVDLVREFVAEVRKERMPVPELRQGVPMSPDVGQVLPELPPDVYPGLGSGRYAIRFRPWLGDVTSQELRLIAQVLKSHALEFRADCDQGFYLAQIRGENVAEVLESLKTFYQPIPAAVPLACTGAATCRLGWCWSRGLALAIRETVLLLPVEKQKQLPHIRISGCPNSCGLHPLAELGFFGSARKIDGRLMPFYSVVRYQPGELGNVLGQKLGEIPAKAIPEFIWQLESLDAVQETLAKFQKIPTYGEAPDYYRDWGQISDFSLEGRGTGASFKDQG